MGIPRLNDFSNVIYKLEEASKKFCIAWKAQNEQEMLRESHEAMVALDYIVNTIIRERDAGNRYLRNYIKHNELGVMVSDTTVEQHNGIKNSNGNAELPKDAEEKAITFEMLLTLIKHEVREKSGFRIENNKHYYLICNNSFLPNRIPSSIVEFEINQFCCMCRQIYSFIGKRRFY